MAVNWFNSDGLLVKFGPAEALPGSAGGFSDTVGNLHIVELRLAALTNLTAVDTIVEENVFLPKNIRIEKVEIVADVAATSGGAATLSVGTVRSDRVTAVAANGLLNAVALADINTQGNIKTYSVGIAGVGSLVGTVTGANPTYITARWTAAAYTAGAVTVRIFWKNP